MLENIFDVPNYYCPRPDFDLKDGYDSFIKTLQYKIRQAGKVDIENISIRCDGQCPNGCQKKFKLKLGKSITKKKYDKIFKHGKSYPNHCLTLNYTGVIKNNG